jgi:hypothetical protein
VEETTADFAEGLAELPPGAAVFVAERTGRVVGCAYAAPMIPPPTTTTSCTARAYLSGP